MPCLPRTAPRDFRALRLAAQLQKPSAPSPPLATVTEHPRLRWGSTGMPPPEIYSSVLGSLFFFLVLFLFFEASECQRPGLARQMDRGRQRRLPHPPVPHRRRRRPQDRLPRGIALTIRPVFIIDSAKKIRLTTMYPASCVRDTAETLGVIGEKGVTTPTGWQVGEDVVVRPAVSTADAKRKSGEGNVREVRPYSRLTTI
ncbi:mitochondrial peroxiredoxin PRX1 [Diplocarpon mali]|nr:mitochondrial peroxiredoxin PRX1 [Diplocarpon mali]